MVFCTDVANNNGSFLSSPGRSTVKDDRTHQTCKTQCVDTAFLPSWFYMVGQYFQGHSIGF